MIKSQFLLDILDLALEHDIEEELLKKQIQFLTDIDFEHTGCGLYIYFKQDDECSKYKVNPKCITNTNDKGDKFYRELI